MDDKNLRQEFESCMRAMNQYLKEKETQAQEPKERKIRLDHGYRLDIWPEKNLEGCLEYMGALWNPPKDGAGSCWKIGPFVDADVIIAAAEAIVAKVED